MKYLMIINLLFTFAFASPEGRPYSYSEKKKKMNIEINQCVLKGKVSDKVKALVEKAPEEDIRKTLKPILKELSEDDLEVLRNCRRASLKNFDS